MTACNPTAATPAIAAASLQSLPLPVLADALGWLDLASVAAVARCSRTMQAAAHQALLLKVLGRTSHGVGIHRRGSALNWSLPCVYIECPAGSLRTTLGAPSPAANALPGDAVAPSVVHARPSYVRLAPSHVNFANQTVTFLPAVYAATGTDGADGASERPGAESAGLAGDQSAAPSPLAPHGYVASPDGLLPMNRVVVPVRVCNEAWASLHSEYVSKYTSQPAPQSSAAAFLTAHTLFNETYRPEFERQYHFDASTPGSHYLGELDFYLEYAVSPVPTTGDLLVSSSSSIDMDAPIAMVRPLRLVAHLSWLMSSITIKRPPPKCTNAERLALIRSASPAFDVHNVIDGRVLAFLDGDSNDASQLVASLASEPPFPPTERRLLIQSALRAMSGVGSGDVFMEGRDLTDAIWKYSFVKRFVATASDVPQWRFMGTGEKRRLCEDIARRVYESERHLLTKAAASST
ncbi:hypothetical protein BC831DRAFT_469551 [Entophlyctis helioformis]|nr:hypothetical protein BC831DRAFT_478866 [Entophlyctis helioformis]KAI8923770.1 hypothetical protein BC831DRAFT_469551 [Entophlyctis helioformis]